MKTKSLSKLKQQLDKLFSQYIRLKYADDNGDVQCYTCSTIKPWKQMQCGHWIPRNNLATRFDQQNCRPQCVGCNMFNRGKYDEFAVHLLKDGVDLQQLLKTKHSIFKVDYFWYQQQIEYYKDLVARRLIIVGNV